MVEHEKCPRCKELGLTTIIVPQRGPKELNEFGDKRVHECFKCKFKSIAVYKKGRDPRFLHIQATSHDPMTGHWYWEVNSPKKKW